MGAGVAVVFKQHFGKPNTTDFPPGQLSLSGVPDYNAAFEQLTEDLKKKKTIQTPYLFTDGVRSIFILQDKQHEICHTLEQDTQDSIVTRSFVMLAQPAEDPAPVSSVSSLSSKGRCNGKDR
ncbi:hypothetical protein J6590_033992 [Homalodisca vitripennis]|nr:hypothetical protein J6590_033992 [Homalodisca vitripennis]